MGSLLQKKVIQLLVKNSIGRNKRYQNLHAKYREEIISLRILGTHLKTFHERINGLCKRLLTLTANLDARSEAVIVAILNNMFSEKASIDDLFASIRTFYANVEKDFKRFERQLYAQLAAYDTPGDMTDTENMLAHMREDVVIFNQMVVEIYGKGVHFLSTLERTMKKINVVFNR